MPAAIRLRPWQRRALDALGACERADFLAVATPGAGKTTFALAAVVRALHATPARVVVVAPTAHLKTQWANAAAGVGLVLDPSWAPGAGALPADVHGIVTTYQQVALAAPAVAGLARRSVVVLDEVHHAGDERSWGDALKLAFSQASMRLSLSGTPFRSDRAAIPFVNYELELARPDFEYGYGEALRDGGVVRPIHFPRVGGQMEWAAGDGTVQSASFDDPLERTRANQRLRAALSPKGDWLPAVLSAAHHRLEEVRRLHRDAGGLVIATDVDHAREIARQLAWRFDVEPALAVSDDAGASSRIAAFAEGHDPWLVAVRMVSEGVDIPRLRVGVYATTTTTELFFRQAVGRFVRYMPGLGERAPARGQGREEHRVQGAAAPAGADQPAWLFIPDDLRLRRLAREITELRRHSLRSEDVPAEEDASALDEPAAALVADRGEQLTLFEVISAVAEHAAGSEGVIVARPVSGAAPPGPETLEDDGALLLELAPPPLPSGRQLTETIGAVPARRDAKKQLREANAAAARELVFWTGRSHAEVNAELNRSVGLARIAEATLEQLERRLAAAQRWRASLS